MPFAGYPMPGPPIKLHLAQFKPFEFPGFPSGRLPTVVPQVTPGNLLSPELWTYSIGMNMLPVVSTRSCLINNFIYQSVDL